MQISIIIPVYREADRIVKLIALLSEHLAPLDHEIIVVDGEPCTSTLSRVSSAGLPWETIRLMPSDQGRGPQMNAGARAAKGDLLFFVHADSRPEPGGLQLMVKAWQTRPGEEFCGAFDLAIDSDRPIFRLIETAASLRSRITRIPYGDQGIFISRQLFDRVGGFPELPLMEDVALMSAVKKRGIKPLFIAPKMHTSARRWETRGVVRTTVSNWIFISLYLLGACPKRLARIYYRSN